MSPRLRLAICFAASLCTIAPRASADIKPGPAPAAPAASAPSSSAPDAATIAAHVRRGDKARVASRWYEAIAAYVEALTAAERAGLPPERIAPILGELGVCELALRKHADAAEHLYLSLEQEAALTGEQRTRYRQAQQSAEREVATVFLGVVPSDALLTVDGRPVGARSAHVLFLEPREHTLRARLPGHVDAVLELKASAGTRADYSLYLPREEPPPVAVAPRLPAPHPPSTDAIPVFRAATLTVAGLGVAAGVGFTIAGSVVDDQIENLSADLGKRVQPGADNACNGTLYPEECARLRSMLGARAGLDTAAQVSFAAGVALGAVAMSTFLWGRSEKRPAPIQVVPVTTGRNTGMAIFAKW